MTDPSSTPDESSVAAAITDGVSTLIVADFTDTASALQAYEALTALQDAGGLDVDGAVVVSKADDGTLTVQETTDRSTRRGATWGAIGGAVVGLLFPPAILGSTVVAGIIGAAIGKGVKVAHKHQLADELHYSIDPGHSGLVALVSDPAAAELASALGRANRIVHKAVQDVEVSSIKSAAKEAQDEVSPD